MEKETRYNVLLTETEAKVFEMMRRGARVDVVMPKSRFPFTEEEAKAIVEEFGPAMRVKFDGLEWYKTDLTDLSNGFPDITAAAFITKGDK